MHLRVPIANIVDLLSNEDLNIVQVLIFIFIFLNYTARLPCSRDAG